MIRQRLFYLLALSLLCLAGCAKKVPDGGAPNSGAVSSGGEAKNFYFGKYKDVVNLLNPTLPYEVHVSKVLVGKNQNGQLRVGLVVTNQTGRVIQTQAQTLYYDEAGNPLYSGDESDQAWYPFTINGIGPTDYYSQAISPLAKHFKIRLRYAPGQKPYSAQATGTTEGSTAGEGETGSSSPTKSRASSKR